MRATKLLVAAVMLIVLPGLAFGQPVVSVDTAAPGGTGGEVIEYDPWLDPPLQFDVLLSTDTGLNAVQFTISINPPGDNEWGDSGKWQTSANPWTMPAPFGQDPTWAGFDYMFPYVNDYAATIGDGYSALPPHVPNDGVSDYPLTPLDLIPGAELYTKTSGVTNVGTDMLVATYEIEAINPDDFVYCEYYVIDIRAAQNGIPSKTVVGTTTITPIEGDMAIIHIVPEPMSLLLLLAGLPFMRRRR